MTTPRSFTRNYFLSQVRIATAVTLISAAAAMAFVAAKTSTSTGHAKISMSRFRALHQDPFETLAGVGRSGEPESSKKIHDGRAQQAYDDRAYPKKFIEAAQQITAANAANAIAALTPAITGPWQAVGPNGVSADALVASESTGATQGTIYSGRTTAIAVSAPCTPGGCTLFLGAAGGGVWKTTNALAATPTWTQVSDAASGIPSNAIGSIVSDPSNPSTIYVGTGEPNGSSDSEAGVGLYKSTDGGSTWSVVPGTDPNNAAAKTAPCADGSGNQCPVAAGRSIGAIAVDPANANHIFIGTDVARHGSSSVNGGRFTPPGSAKVGLYESTDGGATFLPANILAQDTVNSSSPTGGDFFRGGCSHIELYRPGTETQVYASFFDYGVFRRSVILDGNSNFNQIFKSAGNGTLANSSTSRTEFSLAPISTGPNKGNLRMYEGDAPAPASFWRVDDANVNGAG